MELEAKTFTLPIVFKLLLDLLLQRCTMGRVIRGPWNQPTLAMVVAEGKFYYRNNRLHGRERERKARKGSCLLGKGDKT